MRNFEQLAKLKDINIKFECLKDESIKVRANQIAFTRVVSNLISNAVKFTPTHGTVNINCNLDPEGHVSIVIKDTGIGIPEDSLKNLFKKGLEMQRAGTDGEKSTGLGLSIVKELMDRQNANISVSSVEDEGTCFYLKFQKSKSDE